MRQKLATRRIAAIFFSLIIAALLGFAGLLVALFIWNRYGSPSADEVTSESVGDLAALVFAFAGGSACLWKFWPRARSSQLKTSSAVGRKPLEP
jgi:hypothetical protein